MTNISIISAITIIILGISNLILLHIVDNIKNKLNKTEKRLKAVLQENENLFFLQFEKDPRIQKEDIN